MGDAQRVVQRFLKVSRWDNAINSTFWSLYWNDRKWHLEESDTPISGTRGFLPEDSQPMEHYEMPTLLKELAGNDEHRLLHIGVSTLRQYMSLQSGIKGPAARAAVIQGYENLFDAVIKQWKSGPDQDPTRLEKLERLLPKLRKKLVWKKVAQ